MMLRGDTVLVTGGSGALGSAVVHSALVQGARVVVLDRATSAPPAGVHRLSVDLADAAAVHDAVAAVGPVDALCALAGGFAMGEPVDAADDGQWQAMFSANVATLRAALKAVVPGMRARRAGRIVTVGAASARQGQAAMSAYTAAKAVVMNLTESLAAELADTGVRVNAVLPTIIDTPANRAAMPGADPAQWVAPADIAQVICFLASAQARAIHGALIPLAGRQGR